MLKGLDNLFFLLSSFLLCLFFLFNHLVFFCFFYRQQSDDPLNNRYSKRRLVRESLVLWKLSCIHIYDKLEHRCNKIKEGKTDATLYAMSSSYPSKICPRALEP